jgi:hypothetical protein
VKAEPGAAKVPPSLLRDNQPDTKPIRSIQKTEEDQTEDADKADVTVSVPRIDGTEASLRTESATVPPGEDPMTFVAKAILKEANVDGVKVLGVSLERGLAVVNFDKGIKGGMGEEQEGSFLKAVQVTFGQFKNVKQVELDCEGEPLSTLGSIAIAGPLDVIRAGESTDSSSKPPEP